MIFPSSGWLVEAVAIANRQPDLSRAIEGLGRDLAGVVEKDPPFLSRDFAAYGRQEGGRFTRVRVLPDPEEIWELEPAYVVRAPYRVWKSLIQGEDPLQAALAGRVRFEGDLAALVRRSSYRYLVDAVLGELVTEFADELRGRGGAA